MYANYVAQIFIGNDSLSARAMVENLKEKFLGVKYQMIEGGECGKCLDVSGPNQQICVEIMEWVNDR